jgi:transcription initiation factor TFIIIB Brf1 subunit/transcription initiation factor TFIIB
MAANSLSFDFIRDRLSHEQLEDLAACLGLCLECGGNLVSRDGEIVCGNCGLVWASENTEDYVPFPEYGGADSVEGSRFEGHWQPGNTLAFLKGLGDPALANGKGKALMRVLARSPNGAEDLGLRAKHVKTLVEWEDPPQLRRVLSRISLLLAQMGQRENWLLADYTGNLARKIVAYKLLTKQTVSYRLGDAIVAYVIQKFNLKANASSTLKVETEDLQLIRQLENIAPKSKQAKPAYQSSARVPFEKFG